MSQPVTGNIEKRGISSTRLMNDSSLMAWQLSSHLVWPVSYSGTGDLFEIKSIGGTSQVD